MKKSISVWLLGLVFAVSMISGCQQKTEIDGSTVLDDPRAECARVSGEWKIFSNGCIDSCSLERSKEPLFCTTAMTDGCDCGADRCWTGKTCEAN
ncbi:MAG: hypothetical protein Q7J54_00735 [Candidatus Woesearchaeota archaeon]|nr:hypothetical protein [Candidatus Woesearchaeota archaeon]